MRITGLCLLLLASQALATCARHTIGEEVCIDWRKQKTLIRKLDNNTTYNVASAGPAATAAQLAATVADPR